MFCLEASFWNVSQEEQQQQQEQLQQQQQQQEQQLFHLKTAMLAVKTIFGSLEKRRGEKREREHIAFFSYVLHCTDADVETIKAF